MEEEFETCDADGVPLGRAPRSRVHAEGLWHRAVHVWVGHPDGRLWLQRRGWDKDINAGAWDVSVGEHLQPGEGYAAAALRGLREELGIAADELEPLGEVRAVCLDRPVQGIHDHELQQAFRAVHPGPVHPDPDELAEVRLVSRAALRAWLAEDPHAFTPGCRNDLEVLGLLEPREGDPGRGRGPAPP